MRGSDRCDEIVRLIDETLADALAPAGRKPTAARRGAGSIDPRHPSCRVPTRAKMPTDGSDRRDLLAAVADFLAGTTPDTAPTIA